jgi:4'-phosphopantetheinyl transferase
MRNLAPVSSEIPLIETRVATMALSLAEGAAEVIAVRLDAATATAGVLVRCLSETERQRARRFVFERDRRRFIVGRAHLRQLLASRLDVPTDDLHFNVSHSGDVAVYAFSRGREIGIDIEAVREMSDADPIAAQFFSRHEHQDYLALSPRDKPVGFFNCWTRKEAYLRVGQVPGDACGWTLHGSSPGPGFVGAAVLQESEVGSTLTAGHP